MCTYRLVPFEQNNSSSFVAGCKVVARVIEFDRGYDIRYKEWRVSNIKMKNEYRMDGVC